MTPPSRLSPLRSKGFALGAACLAGVGGVIFFTYQLVPLFYWTYWTRAFAGSLAALTLLVAFSRAPGRHIVAASGLLTTFPLLYIGADSALYDRITSDPLGCACTYCSDTFTFGSFENFPWSLPDGGFATLSPILFPLFGAFGALLAFLILRVRPALPPWIRAGGGVALRVVGLASLALAAPLLVSAWNRAQTYPAPEDYLASLPVMAVVPPVSGDPFKEVRSVNRGSMGSTEARKIYKDHIAGLVIERSCGSFDAVCAVDFDGKSSCREIVRGAAEITLRRDADGGLIFVEDGEGRFAFRDGLLVHLTLHELAGRMSPSMGWIGAGLLGMLLAVWFKLRRRSVRKRLDRLAAATPGFHGEDGWIVADDERPAFRADPDLKLPVGPVLIFSGARRRGAVYRDGQSAEPVDILAGTRDDLMEERRREVAALDVLAVAAVGLGIAPLLALAGAIF